MASQKQVSDWFDLGVRFQFKFLVLAWDGLEKEAYPVFAGSAMEVWYFHDHVAGKGEQRFCAVYTLDASRKAEELAKCFPRTLPERQQILAR